MGQGANTAGWRLHAGGVSSSLHHVCSGWIERQRHDEVKRPYNHALSKVKAVRFGTLDAAFKVYGCTIMCSRIIYQPIKEYTTRAFGPLPHVGHQTIDSMVTLLAKTTPCRVPDIGN
jgi:hypothetical protein